MIDHLAKVSMGALFVAAVPVDEPSLGLWAQWGLAGVVVAYVLWRDSQREGRMGKAIDLQERWVRETLVRVLERNAAAMERMVAWLEQHRGDDAHR